MTLASHDLRERIAWWAEKQPDKIAFTFLARGEEITRAVSFGQLFERAASIANVLTEMGLAGKPAVLLYAPGLDFIEAILASFLSGVIAVPVPYPINSRARRRISGIVTACRAAAVLTLQIYCEQEDLRADLDASHVSTWIATDLIATDKAAALRAPRDRASERTAFLQFTSGSTESPRGVIISFANLAANHQMISSSFGKESNLICVTWLPMFHDMGLIGTVLYPAYAGWTTHIMPPFAFLQKPVRWLRAMSRFQATGTGAPSFAYELCARSIKQEDCEDLDLHRWQTAFCGSEPVRRAALSRFAEAFGPFGFDPSAFLPCYGLAEATLYVSGSPTGSGLRVSRTRNGLVSCGAIARPQKLQIVDAQGAPLPDEVEGEIWIAGPHISAGYWQDADATRRTFGAQLPNDPGTPYLKTGDVGFVEDGELFVSGRLKDILIVRGTKLHANDLDRTISGADPVLLPAAGAVFTLEEDGQERIVAIHEIRKSAFSGLDHDTLFKTVARAISVEHGIRLDRAIFVREGRLPRTTSGKLQRNLCRRLLTDPENESEESLAR